MKRFPSCCWFALSVCAPVHAAGVVRIAAGDCSALQAAIAGATPDAPVVDIALAPHADYGYCPLAASGNANLDGEGATLQVTPAPDVAAVAVAAGAHLSLRDLNFGPTPQTIPPVNAAGGCGIWITPPPCPQVEAPIFSNAGTLLLDAVSVANVDLNFGPLLYNGGSLTLRNSTIVNNHNGSSSPLPVGIAGSTLEIDHSTIAFNDRYGLLYADIYPGKGVIRARNSILQAPTGPVCFLPIDLGEFVSEGGNVFSDTSCGTPAANDRIAADIRALDFGPHGGVVGTLALGYDSPAIGNGLAANCEATDARGLARGPAACDAGAYEFGGGVGRLAATGMSGAYYNPANDGHYVTIQRLAGDTALVIWNTFDQHGTPAWLYGVGNVNEDDIVVPEVAQNIGGTLQPGGGVSGASPVLWGALRLHLDDCMHASLSYSSPSPAFGTGSTPLQRIALLGGVNCAP